MNDNLDYKNIEIFHRLSNKEMEMNLHFHNSYEMIYVKSGKSIFHINNKDYVASSGSLIFLSNLEKHEIKVVEYPYDRYVMLINPDYFLSIFKNPILTSIFRHRPEHFSYLLNLTKGVQTQIETYFENMITESVNKEEHYELSITSELSLLFVHLYRNYSSFFPMATLNRTTTTVLEIQKYIDENSQTNISLSEIAKKYYIDMYYLSRIFKSVTGFSFKEYVILQRISKAKNLLFYTTEDITQVGLRSGFNNTNHFIKLFKKYEGITPYQYRKQVKQKKEN